MKVSDRSLAWMGLLIVPAFAFGLSLKYIEYNSTLFNVHLWMMFLCTAISAIATGVYIGRRIK